MEGNLIESSHEESEVKAERKDSPEIKEITHWTPGWLCKQPMTRKDILWTVALAKVVW
jgi:hypothetical protein